MWSQQNMIAATLTPVLGLACSLIAWLVTAKKQYGDLSVASTGMWPLCFPLTEYGELVSSNRQSL